MIIVRGFLSGLLTILYLFTDNWYWIFGVAFFIGCGVLETKDIHDQFEDDERMVL